MNTFWHNIVIQSHRIIVAEKLLLCLNDGGWNNATIYRMAYVWVFLTCEYDLIFGCDPTEFGCDPTLDIFTPLDWISLILSFFYVKSELKSGEMQYSLIFTRVSNSGAVVESAFWR